MHGTHDVDLHAADEVRSILGIGVRVLTRSFLGMCIDMVSTCVEV